MVILNCAVMETLKKVPPGSLYACNMNRFAPWCGQYMGVLWGVVVSLPILVLLSTQDLGNLVHHYFILYLHLSP